MKNRQLFIIFILICQYACAQTTPAGDSTQIPPGTVVVVGSITNTSGNSATLKIEEVVGSGQGIINLPAAGQQMPVQVTKGVKVRTGEKVRAHLKEKLEADASRSSYEIVQVKKL
jgi:hypothetical protein